MSVVQVLISGGDLPVSPATGAISISTWQNNPSAVVFCTNEASFGSAGPNDWVVQCNATNPAIVTVGESITIINSALGINGTWGITSAASPVFHFATTGETAQGKFGGATWTRTPPGVAAITRSGTTATLQTSSACEIQTGEFLTIVGADQWQYNGTFAVTRVDSTHFTYTIKS